MLNSLVVIAPHQSNGLLEPGVHWIAKKVRLVELFGANGHRRQLLNGFFEAALLLRQAGCSMVFLDGSFVTTKEFPNDFDCCWDTEGVALEELDPVFLDFSNCRARQKAKFGGEFFPTRARAKAPWTTFFEFFQMDKHTGSPKGIVGINLASFS